jgi:hypothetical protein
MLGSHVIGATNVSPNCEYKVLYHTYSLCPVCSFVEQQGIDKTKWKRSQVVNHRNQVYQRIECDSHGIQTILLCSNTAFFERCLSFSPGLLDVLNNSKSSEIEELDKRIGHLPGESPIMNIPFMIECTLYEFEQFKSDDELRRNIDDILKFIPSDKNFILKLNAQLVPLDQIHILNAKMKQVLAYKSRISEQPLVLECTFDRISRLANLEDTVLLNNKIYPSVQIYIEKGKEEHNTRELKNAYEALRTIKNLEVIVRLVVSKPLPDLAPFLKLLRFEMVGFTRFVIIEMERTPAQIMQQFKPNNQDVENRFAEVHRQPNFSYSLDPLELLYNIEMSTKGQIAISDFYPASTGVILEPLLRLIGKGNYNIRPSPFCGFASILINTKAQFKSVPITRIFNIDLLYKSMIPLVKKLEKSNGNLGFFTGRSLKKAINQSVIPESQRKQHFKIPSDFVSYITSDEAKDEAREMLDKMQFIIIHNQMDVGSVDMVKRSRCSVCSYYSSNGKLIAQCTKCI